MLIESTSGKVYWLPESKSTPKDKRLWNAAIRLSRMEKHSSAYVANLVARRIYQMLGGIFEKGK